MTSSISDHLFQFSQLYIFYKNSPSKITKNKRDFRNFIKMEFSEELSKTDWSNVTGTEGCYNNLPLKIDMLLKGVLPSNTSIPDF